MNIKNKNQNDHAKKQTTYSVCVLLIALVQKQLHEFYRNFTYNSVCCEEILRERIKFLCS
jgi:hypothetical protein